MPTSWLNWSDFAVVRPTAHEYLLVRRAEGISAATAGAALGSSPLIDDPLAVGVEPWRSAEESRRLASAESIQFNVLLAVSMVIAGLGIANALLLVGPPNPTGSRRSCGATGLSRRQLYGMLLIESTLTALISRWLGRRRGLLAPGWAGLPPGCSSPRTGHGAPDRSRRSRATSARRRWPESWPPSFRRAEPPERR